MKKKWQTSVKKWQISEKKVKKSEKSNKKWQTSKNYTELYIENHFLRKITQPYENEV